MTDIALVVLVFAPVVITFFFKSNAGLGFLTLCLGFVLSTSVIGDLKQLLSQQNLTVTNETLAIALVLLPFLLTMFLSAKSAGKDTTLFLQLITAFFAGCLLVITIGPLLGTTGQFSIVSSKLWEPVIKSQALIIGLGSILSLVLVWMPSAKKPKKH